MNKVIAVKKDNVYGNPHLVGTRITVFDIVSDCNDNGIQQTMNDNSLSIETIELAFKYCSQLKCVLDGGHCGGCLLRNYQDKILTQEDFINRFSKVVFEDSDEIIQGNGEGVMIMPETPIELSENWIGQKTWLLASEQLSKLKNKLT